MEQRLAEDQRLVSNQWGRLMEGVKAGIKVKDEEERAWRACGRAAVSRLSGTEAPTSSAG